MRILLAITSFVLLSFSLQAQLPFVTTWKTDNPGRSEDNQITIPTTGTGYNYTVNWGDGTSDNGVTGNITHTYDTPGIYTVSIVGDFPHIFFDDRSGDGEGEKILSVEQWGNNIWASMRNAFDGCRNLTIPASDAPDLSLVTNMSAMFRNASSFNGLIEHWNVSNVTSMLGTFSGASSFNQPLNNWDVSSVTNMDEMFRNASSFNQPLNSWNVGEVIIMRNMFLNASSFNQSLSTWDVSKVVLMNGMFALAEAFNGEIGSWDVTSVTSMVGMFSSASSFNQPIGNWSLNNDVDITRMFTEATSFNSQIGNWDVSQVTSLDGLFNGASSFNQDISNWNVSNVRSMFSTFRNTTSFNEPLDNWDVSSVTSMFSMFFGSAYNQPLASWNVGNVRDMRSMFQVNFAFNQPLNSWDVSNVTNMDGMFGRASSFDQPLDLWDVSNVTSMFSMFSGTTFNQPLNTWDVSSVDNMAAMFDGATLFNQPLDNWNVSNVLSTANMFRNARAFNQNIEVWDIANVLGLFGMFNGASAFNQPLNNWDVSSVTEMAGLFSNTPVFNQPLNLWDVSNVTNMRDMFNGSSSFNQDISSWNVSSVTNMSNMFRTASSFNQSIATWDVSNVTNMARMLDRSGLSLQNYEMTLEGWINLPSLQNNIEFGVSMLEYCQVENVRQQIIDSYSWTFSGDRINCFNATSGFDFTINENSNNGLTVGLLDGFSMIDGPFTFAITSGNVGNAFSIDNMLASIIINDSVALNFESNPNFNLEIEITDSNNTTTTVSSIITLTNVNEAPFFDDQNFSVVENSSASTVLGSLVSSDEDGDDISYTILEGNISEAFIISPNGEISINNPTAVDFETNPIFNLSVSAFDSEGNATIANVQITVSDFAEIPFITTWKTDNPGATGDNQIRIPAFGAGYNYNIDWGDGTTDIGITGGGIGFQHTYAVPGTYTVSITGEFPRIRFSFQQDQEKILTVEQWGNIAWESFEDAFVGCTNLTVPATDAPDLTRVTNMSSMFQGATSFNQPIGHWDISNVEDISEMFSGAISFNQPLADWNLSGVNDMFSLFAGATAFNQPLDSWDVSNVTIMSSLFSGATLFNQPINNWDVGLVTNMAAMFRNAVAFNQPIGSWNTQNVTFMVNMFEGATIFNQPIGTWNTGNVTRMDSMFENAVAFDQPIGDWDVSNVTDMSSMFRNANVFNQPIANWNLGNVTNISNMFRSAIIFNQPIGDWDVSNVIEMRFTFLNAISFNQPLNNWNVSSVTDMRGMFSGSSAFDQSLSNWNVSNVTDMSIMIVRTNLSTQNYDATILGWSQLPSLQNNVLLGVEDLNYCNADAARQQLINDYGWNIEGDSRSCIDFESMELTVDENTAEGIIVGPTGIINVGNQALTYNIVNGNNSNAFRIDSITNEFIVNNQDAINFEFNSRFLMNVDVVGEDGESRSLFLRINVNDLNENPEIINQSFELTENSPNGTTVGIVTSSDIDADDVITYSLLNTGVNPIFAIEESSGELSILNEDAIDFELNRSIMQEVLVTDSEGLTDTAFITVNITNVPEFPFITTWKTDEIGVSEDNQITIPTTGNGYHYTIDWGDGNSDTEVTGNITHTYDVPGTYTVSIIGDFPRIFFNDLIASGNQVSDSHKILTIEEWGDNSWVSMRSAFAGCVNLTVPALDAPNFSEVSDLGSMFEDATSFNQSIEHWDVSNIQNMQGMFEDATSFNQPLNNWDVSNVSSMNSMFSEASSFNQPLNNWDVRLVSDMQNLFAFTTSFNQPLDNWNVTNVRLMRGMFNSAIFDQDISMWDVSNVTTMSAMFIRAGFNQDISAWDVGNVENMSNMFESTSFFNQDISSWNVSNVTDMSDMFNHARAFNQPLGDWDVSQVINMNLMFNNAFSFNQDLSNWDISNVLQMSQMLSGSNLSRENYDRLLTGWSSLPMLQSDVTLGAGNLIYCASESDRNSIISNYNWNILGDRINCIDVEDITFSINENVSNGVLIGSVPATNLANGDLTYEIIEGNTGNAFQFLPSSNELSIDDPIAIDFETNPVFELTISVSDGSSMTNSVITINVLDVNEAPTLENSSFIITEFSEIGTLVGQLNGVDPENDDLIYRIIEGNETGTFSINAAGEIMVNNTFALSAEINPLFELNIEVSDGEFSNESSVVIELLPLEDIFPSMLERAGLISFTLGDEAYIGSGNNESTYFADFYRVNPITKRIVPLSSFPGNARSEAVSFVLEGKAYIGTGVDENGNNLSDFYSYDPTTNQWERIADISNGRRAAVAFVLNDEAYVGTGRGDTDELSDFWKYNVETNSWTEVLGFTGSKRQEAVAFVANGKGYVSGGFLFDGFTEQLSDVQEYDPEMDSWRERVFADIDLNFQGATAFTIANQAFIAYGNQDQITHYNPLTNEINNLGDTLGIDNTGGFGTVRADAISFVLADTAYFGFGRSGFTPTVYHADLHQFFIPNVAPSDIVLSNNRLDENVTNIIQFGDLTAVDNDVEDTHSFRLINGDGINDADNNKFQIINGNGVSPRFPNTFDFESQNQFSIYIRATDNNGAFIDKAIEIFLNDLNDAPVFEVTSFTIEEHSAVGSVVGDFIVSDQDNDAFSLSLLVTNNSNLFAIDENRLVVNDSDLLDFERVSEITISVLATDARGATSNMLYDVLVTNVNEAPIVNERTLSITENSARFTSLGILSSDPENDQITNSIISGNDNNTFGINENGELFINDSTLLDAEINSNFILSIEATDGTLIGSGLITVDVLNINESPTITDTTYQIVANTNVSVGTVVGDLGAIDPEEDDLVYVIVSGNRGGAFEVNSNGELFVSNREAIDIAVTPVFNLVIQIFDEEFFDEANITVELIEITSVENISTSLAIFPNPAKENLMINFGDLRKDQLTFEIIDLRGMITLKGRAEESLNISKLSSGTYILRILGENKVGIYKFFKE